MDLRFEHLELRTQGSPAVDHEEDVAVSVIGESLGAALSVGVDRVDAVLPEIHLARVEQAGDLGDRAAHDVGLGARRHAADVRETLQSREAATAEVDDEELHLLWCVREGEGDQRGAGEGALAACLLYTSDAADE